MDKMNTGLIFMRTVPLQIHRPKKARYAKMM